MTINIIITKLDYKSFKSFDFMQENKIKTMKIYLCIFSEHLECVKGMKRRWNAIFKIKQTSLSCVKPIIFLNKYQCQPTIILKLDSSTDEP